jgi:hypothetical protein
VTDTLFRDEQHPRTGRWAVFEDDGVAAWLYLTAPGAPRPAGACWIYNRGPAPPRSALAQYRGKPPPAAQGYAGPDSQYSAAGAPEIRFLWSADGEAVAVFVNGAALGCIIAGAAGGPAFSRNLLRAGGWGAPWDENLYQRTFHAQGPG